MGLCKLKSISVCFAKFSQAGIYTYCLSWHKHMFALCVQESLKKLSALAQGRRHVGEDVFTHYMDFRLQFKYAAFFQAPPNSFFQQVSVYVLH